MESADCDTEEESAPEACVSSEGPLLPSTSREIRNRAEKQRRDKLNAFISELAKLVPTVARSPKRMDKTSILRLTATHLRIYHTLLNAHGQPQMEIPKFVDQFVLEQLVCDQLGGFLLILTSKGKVVFVSPSVEHLLSHLQTDLLGQSLFNITASEDHERLKTYLNCEGVMEAEWRKYFKIRLKRAGPRTESPVYETVKMMGMHRQWSNLCGSPCSSSSGGRELLSPTSSTSSGSSVSNDLLVFFVKIIRAEPLVDQLIQASKDEYITRHLIDGRIIHCDQRISLIAGYMIEEVSGHSAFKYMHRDDVRWVMIALRQMYDRGESRGSSCYRLMSRTGTFIYLRTFGFLDIDDNGTVESFICVNTLVSEKEGIQGIQEMKKKFSAIIKQTQKSTAELEPSCQTSGGGATIVDLVEDPEQVDQIVADHLMSNLTSTTNGSENGTTTSPGAHNENEDCLPTADFPVKSYQVKYKTATKRSPSTDVDANLNKRMKPSCPLSPL